MLQNLPLFHKFLIPVAVLLSFETVFVFTVNGMLQDLQRTAVMEHEIGEAIDSLNDLYIRISQIARLVTAQALGKISDSAVIEYRQTKQIIPQDLRNVSDNFRGDQGARPLIEKISDNTVSSLRIIDESLESLDKASLLRKLRQLKGRVPELLDQLLELRAHASELKQDKLFHLQRQQKQLSNALLAAACANVFLALALLFYFHRNITRRLGIVMQNLTRVVKKEPLVAVVGGDEIGRLDTSLRDMAVALEKAQLERKRIEKLKQEFVSMVSHDLRTPLTSIQIFLSMVAKGMIPDVDAIQNKAATADRNVTRLIGLINDLLDIEKMESGDFSLELAPTSLLTTVERAVDSIRGYGEKSNVNIDSVGVCEVSLTADGDRLVQVLVNLLGNAIKFSPDGGTVKVATESENGLVKVKVIDQGRGVPKHLQDDIFERFKQVEAKDASEKKGAGLGLSIVKQIVSKHGGACGVESEDGKGSVFWFTLPLSSPASGGLTEQGTDMAPTLSIGG